MKAQPLEGKGGPGLGLHVLSPPCIRKEKFPDPSFHEQLP